MNNQNLSVCIPSNRKFATSKESISSGIGFCEATNSELIVSDNSDDKIKSEFWGKLNLPNFKYLQGKNNSKWNDNWLNGINSCSGKFTSIVSDDDLIVNLGQSSLNYQDLKSDIVAVKPIISLWNDSIGIYKINNFNIDANKASDRIMQYLKLAAGNNTTYYSFYKTKELKNIYSLLYHHPTKGGYIDWAITISLIASGKIILDKTKLLIYKNTNWYGDEAYINNKIEELFLNSGLKKNSNRFERVFRALDCFILIMRKNSNLDYQEKLNAAVFTLELNINFFKEYYNQNLNKFLDYEQKAITNLSQSTTIAQKLESCLNIVANDNPFIEEKYKEFYLASLEKKWSNI